MNRRFIRQVLLFALFYYLAVLSLDGIIFMLSHIPPRVFNMDGLLLRLAGVQHFLVWPRNLLRNLWPGELLPAWANFILAVLNCLIWGLIFAGLQNAWSNARK